ncbi:MAG: dihydropteroate synthase [Planctomycetota bacterium]|nr:MAG: dihydropteroate synthase [Planctomycetota bacterium]
MASARILLVTGHLAAPALRRMAERLNRQAQLACEVAELDIQVAALMNTRWLASRLPRFLARHTGDDSCPYDRIVVPGYCTGNLEELAAQSGLPLERGPKDLLELPDYFGQSTAPEPLKHRAIEIVAEINHAPRLSTAELLSVAERYRTSGADVIDLGCVPGERWHDVGRTVRTLRQAGHRVSIDSFDRREVEAAVEAGAELVFSVNSSNIDWAAALPAELVVIPDRPDDFASLVRTAERLLASGRPIRIDPILEPIGHGFASSLQRYFLARRRWPDTPMLMGVGNVTELTEVDSAGVNMLLAAICRELDIGSVLTTEVANWCRSAIREFDIAARMVEHAISRGALPKGLGESLVVLRDRRLRWSTDEEIAEWAGGVRDPNFRIAVTASGLHLFNREGHWRGTDPFDVFRRMLKEADDSAERLTPEHAFYMGYELAKAAIARTLHKNYRQDEPLDWNFLTVSQSAAPTHNEPEPTVPESAADRARTDP